MAYYDKDYQKKYYQEHKEELKEKNKKNRQNIKCICGGRFSIYNYGKHKETKKHIFYVLENKDKIFKELRMKENKKMKNILGIPDI